MITIVLIIVLLILIYVNFGKRRRAQELVKQFTGPPHYPIIGHAIPTRWSVKKVFYELISEWFHKYKSPSTIYLICRSPIVLIYDPENFQIVANKTLEKGNDYEFIRRFYGNGLATINNINQWKKRRRLLFPTVNLKVMGSYYLNIFNELNNELIEDLKQYSDTGSEINLWPIIHSKICSTFFASFMKYNKKDEKDIDLPKLGLAIPSGLKFILDRVFYPWLYGKISNKIYEWISGRRHVFQDFDASKQKIFHKLKKRIDSNANDSSKEELFSKIFIDTLSSKKVSQLYQPKEIIEEIMTFMIGATETSASNICFTALMMAMHEDCQQKVFEEIQSVIGDENKTANLDELNQLVYLDQCINETLRLFPSIPWIARRITQDVILSDGRILPTGCDALLAIIGIHRSASIYENPTLWQPDRFLPDEVAKRHPCSFVPFSVGPRNCLAAKIGLLSIKSQLVSLIQNYKFTTNMKLSDIKLNFDVDLRNETGFHVRLQKRK